MIKLYIANLGAYNRGELIGKWVELPDYDIDETIQEILEAGEPGDEEVAIHDYECDFMAIGEYDDIYELNELAEEWERLDTYEESKLMAILEWGYYNAIQDAIDNLDDFNLMEDITSDKEFGEYLVYDSGIYDIPEHLICYIDCEKFGRDAYISTEGYYSEYGFIERI